MRLLFETQSGASFQISDHLVYNSLDISDLYDQWISFGNLSGRLGIQQYLPAETMVKLKNPGGAQLKFPPSSSQFFCDECDVNLVDVNDDTTGSCFAVHGKTLDINPGDRSVSVGNQELIAFAICKHCLQTNWLSKRQITGSKAPELS